MKKIRLGLVGTILVFWFCAFVVGCIAETKEEVVLEAIENQNTSLCVVNSTGDSVLAYLTLGSIGDTNYVQSTLGIFGIMTSGTQNSFVIPPFDTLFYNPAKGLNGNVTFGASPQNCPDTTQFPTGINLFEFNLNDNFVINAQETIDISCVSGVNSFMSVLLNGGGLWNNGIDTISEFCNLELYNNSNRSGVFPFGCDSCTSITSKTPYCAGHKPYATPQKTNICNIQRNAVNNGGNVYIQFNGYTNTQICK